MLQSLSVIERRSTEDNRFIIQLKSVVDSVQKHSQSWVIDYEMSSSHL